MREEANGEEEEKEIAMKDMVEKAMAKAQCICSTCMQLVFFRSSVLQAADVMAEMALHTALMSPERRRVR